MPISFLRLATVTSEMRNRVLGERRESMGQVRENGLVYGVLPGLLVLEVLQDDRFQGLGRTSD